MESKNRMTLAVIVIVVIAIVSVAVGYVCFNILESSAEATLKEWKLGGGIAAIILTFSILASMLMQIYKLMAKSEAEELQEQLADQKEKSNHLIMELQNKLIRGAPTPEGFTIDVDEKHKLVFARPVDWVPRGDFLYQYIRKGFASNFNVISKNQQDIEELFKTYNWGEFNIDNLYLKISNGDLDALKVGVPYKSEPVVIDEYINIDNLKSLKRNIVYEPLNGTRLHFIGAYTYVPRLKALYCFTFTDEEENFVKISEIFNIIINSIRFL